MTPPGDGKRYVRAIEAAWSRLRARPAVLSPRDFEVVEAWRRRRIPLGVVLEVLDHQARRRSARAPRSLAYLTPAVEEAWATVAVGRAAVASPPPAASDAPTDVWSEALERAREGTPLRTLLERLRSQAAQGGDPGALDDALDLALADAVPAELRERCESETRAALAPFRGRMTDEELRKTFERGRADRLRAALGLARLTFAR